MSLNFIVVQAGDTASAEVIAALKQRLGMQEGKILQQSRQYRALQQCGSHGTVAVVSRSFATLCSVWLELSP